MGLVGGSLAVVAILATRPPLSFVPPTQAPRVRWKKATYESQDATGPNRSWRF